jgi:Protein kinase domain
VAIKIVRPALAGATLIRRFHHEREIMAGLDHPNIARLFDAGTTEDGMPYFVMEYVEGQTIDSWCNERKLNVTERLELFRSVCSALQYAHQKLVVHLDLKPGNILVNSEGIVKLLDFGIARLLQPHGEEGVTAYTMTLLQGMTPEYASPEQVQGMPISTASDVYSLGVVLYELLTGHRPYRMKSRILLEVARVICEEEPTQPSMIVTQSEEIATPEAVSEVREGSPARLRRRLEGDLDNILLKALRKEPARRYSSAEQLNEDLRKHLGGFPVTAREDTLGYRVQKFVRRNRVGVIAGAFVAATLFAGVITTLWQARLAFARRASVGSTAADGAICLRRHRSIWSRSLLQPSDFAASAGRIRGRPSFLWPLSRTRTSCSCHRLVAVCAQRHAANAGVAARVRHAVLGHDVGFDQLAHRSTVRLERPAHVRWNYDYLWSPTRSNRHPCTGLIVFALGLIPLFGDAMLWAVNVVGMHAAMRLVGGPARSDRLTRSGRYHARMSSF